MPHSNFTFRVTYSGTEVYECSCGQTFESGTEQRMDMKLKLHHRFCSKLPTTLNRKGVPRKAYTIKEHNLAEVERIRKVHN